MLSIFRLPESGLVLKNRESSLDIWTIGALKTATQTSNTTAAICLSVHLANSSVFRHLQFVFPSAPLPWLRLRLETRAPRRWRRPHGRAQLRCFRNTSLLSWLLLTGRANYANLRHLFGNLNASVLGTVAVLPCWLADTLHSTSQVWVRHAGWRPARTIQRTA